MAPQFKVLITGASFGGVTLAILLERAGVNYELFESFPSIPQIGSAIILGPTIMPLFEQLGLLHRVEAISKPIKTMHLVEEQENRIGEIDLSNHKNQTGYNSLATTRPELLSLLISQIPSHKIHFSKPVVSFTANKDYVVIRCADDTTYKGEILVGADGAYSKIRDILYKQIAKKGILPRNDAAALALDTAVAMAINNNDESLNDEIHQQGANISLVGVTQPLDPELYPILKVTTDSQCYTVVGDHSHHSWTYFTVPGNRIAWTANTHLEEAILHDRRTHSSSTSSTVIANLPPSPTPSSASLFSTTSSSSSSSTTDASSDLAWDLDSSNPNPLGKHFLEECRSFKAPMLGGKTFGDLIDATPTDIIGRAITEQTLYETWHHGRTVLIGDASHRMLSNAANQGVVNSMEDGIILANLIRDLPSSAPEPLIEIFKDFQTDRYPHVKAQMQMNDKVAKLMSAQNWSESLMRKFAVRYMSKIRQHFCDDKILADRPQATFMPTVASRGSVHALPQRPHKVFGVDSKH